MLATKPQVVETSDTAKLELYRLIGEGYKAMQEGRTSTIDEVREKLTEKQLREVEEAKTHLITFDKDCEELSPAMMKAFKSATVQRNRRKKA